MKVRVEMHEALDIFRGEGGVALREASLKERGPC